MVRMKERQLSRTEGLEIVQKWLLGAQFWRVFTELDILYYRTILSRKKKWSDVSEKKKKWHGARKQERWVVKESGKGQLTKGH